MVRKLGARLHEFGFPGEMNHVRCFDHVISLTAKSVLALFDATNGREHDDSLLDDAEKALMELAEGLEAEEEMARATGSDDSASAPEGEADSTSDNTKIKPGSAAQPAYQQRPE